MTLTTDPRLALMVDADGNVTGDTPVPRQTIHAGMSIQVHGLFGRRRGRAVPHHRGDASTRTRTVHADAGLASTATT